MEHRRRRARLLRVLITQGRAGDCPNDAELAEFLDRTLIAARASALEAHFDRCQVCRELVFMLAGLDPEKGK